MKDSDDPKAKRSPKLAWTLSALFLFALIMGPGPGLYLINDYAANGGTLLGAPALYAWVVFWFAVEATIVVTAYRTIWKEDAE